MDMNCLSLASRNISVRSLRFTPKRFHRSAQISTLSSLAISICPIHYHEQAESMRAPRRVPWGLRVELEELYELLFSPSSDATTRQRGLSRVRRFMFSVVVELMGRSMCTLLPHRVRHSYRFSTV